MGRYCDDVRRGIALLSAGGAKVMSAFVKSDKTIEGSEAMTQAYKNIGDKWSAFTSLMKRTSSDWATAGRPIKS